MQSTLSTPSAFPQCTRDRRAGRFSSWLLHARRGAALALLALVAACGGGSGGSGGDAPPGVPVSVGGTVSGLTALGLVIRNGTETLAISENGRFLFPTRFAQGSAVNVEVVTQPAFQQCTVANGQFTLGAQSVTNVAITCAGVQARFAYTAADQSDVVNAYRMSDTTGVLTRNTPFSYATGDRPRAIAGDVQGTVLFTANFDADTLTAFRIDRTSGALTQVTGSPFAAPVQPRALAVHPGGRFLYVVGQGANVVQAYAIDAQGALTGVGTPLGTAFTPEQVLVTPDGRHVLVLNRGSGSISVYRTDADTGALAEVAGSPFFIGVANAFALHPGGRLLLTVDTSISPTDNVATFSFDPASGAVTRPVTVTLPSAIGAAFHPNGTDVYLTTTGVDPRVHHYTVNATTGQLAATPDVAPTISAGSAAVAVDPTGQYLEVLTGRVYGFVINPTTRALTAIAPANALGSPDAQGIVFVR